MRVVKVLLSASAEGPHYYDEFWRLAERFLVGQVR